MTWFTIKVSNIRKSVMIHLVLVIFLLAEKLQENIKGHSKKVNKKVPGFIMPGMVGYCIKVITRMAGEKVFGSVSIIMVKQQALVITKMERRMVCGKTSLILVCCQM